MSFWEKFKEFDKMMSEPAIAIFWETKENDQEAVKQLLLENQELKRQLQEKRIKSIDTEFKLLE